MDDQTLERYVEAGEAVQEAKQVAREEADPGTSFLELARAIEGCIRERGLEPAFPVNLSRNEEAAHFTPPPDGDGREVKPGDVLKVDIGAHCDGYIADTAVTLNPDGSHSEMIDEVEQLLETALDILEAGMTVGEFGERVEQEAPDGYNVVRNLTGHYLGRHEQHAGISIPNRSNGSDHVFEQGDAVAIEPFLSTGSGEVIEGATGNIYRQESSSVRNRTGRELMGRIEEFKGMPFSPRWLGLDGRERLAFQRMVKDGQIHSYPILRDDPGSKVVQAEHTVLIGMADDGGNLVTTRSGS